MCRKRRVNGIFIRMKQPCPLKGIRGMTAWATLQKMQKFTLNRYNVFGKRTLFSDHEDAKEAKEAKEKSEISFLPNLPFFVVSLQKHFLKPCRNASWSTATVFCAAKRECF